MGARLWLGYCNCVSSFLHASTHVIMICFHWILGIEIAFLFLVLKFVFHSRHHNGVLTKLLTDIKIDVVPYIYKSTMRLWTLILFTLCCNELKVSGSKLNMF